MIKQRMMGRTGLKISELCLGTLNFGWKTDENTAHAILDAFYAAGGNAIQASSWSPELMLPSASTHGSEHMVGRWWRARQIPREKLFLTTRIHVPTTAHAGTTMNVVRDALQASLGRLQTDYVDLVVFEWNDDFVPLERALHAFDLLVRSGATRFVGAANFPTWRVVAALGLAYRRDHNRLEALQSDYSLMTRARFEPEAMALCQEQRLGFFATSPLAGGFLGRDGKLESMLHAVRRNRLIERFGNAYGALAQAAVADVARRQNASSAQVALAWVLHNPAVTTAVIGVNSVAQLNDLISATSLCLSGSDLEQLDRATVAEEVRVPSELPRTRLARRELMLN